MKAIILLILLTGCATLRPCPECSECPPEKAIITTRDGGFVSIEKGMLTPENYFTVEEYDQMLEEYNQMMQKRMQEYMQQQRRQGS